MGLFDDTPSFDTSAFSSGFDNVVNSVSNGSAADFNNVTNSITGAINVSANRLLSAGLNFGGGSTGLGLLNSTPTININGGQAKDWRVRLSLPVNFPAIMNGQNLAPLSRTGNGVVFPYTPTVAVTHNARYQEQSLTHSNYKNYFYEGSDVAEINISGEFTVQNIAEGQYLMAAIYFFRTCTKMFFGADQLAGNPPPILFLDGYGDFYFPHVSCIVKSFTHNMPADVDYLEIPTNTLGNYVSRLPTTSTISVTVQPVYSRQNVYNRFNLNQFASGQLIGQSTGGTDIAGFI